MNDAPQRAQDTIRQTVVDVGGIVSGVADRVKSIINDALKAIFDPLGAALQAQVSVFGDLVGGLLQSLATPEDIGQQLADWWASNPASSEFGPGAIANFLGQSAPAKFADWYGNEVAKDLHDWFVSGPPDTPNAVDPETIRQAWATTPLLMRGTIGLLVNIITASAFLGALNSANVNLAQQASMIDELPMPLSPAEVATAVVQSQVGDDWAKTHVARSGISPELFDIMVNTAGDPPGMIPVLELWRRGVINEAQVDQALAESRLKNKYIDPIKKLATVLPSPSDLIRFLVRDALDDQVAQSLQLDTDFDAKYKQDLFFQVGLDKTLAQYYWRSHWQLPSPGELYEMFHRTSDSESQWSEPVQLPSGKTVHRILSQDQIRETLKIDDHLPPFLDKYLQISFQPPTRIDARRMYLANVFDDDDLYRAFIDEGYTADFSTKMLGWMQQAKADAQKKQAQKDAAPLVTALHKAYNDGLIGAGELKQRLVSFGGDPDVIDVQIAQLDQDRERTRADKIRDGVRRLFVQGYIDEGEAGSRLIDEGFTSAEWARLRDDWRVDLEFRELSDEQKRAHELTKNTLLEAFTDQLIQEPELRDRLTNLGYQQDEINVWLSLAKYNGAKRVADIAREGTHEDFVDGLISDSDVRDQLVQIGTPSEAIEAYLRRWRAEARRRIPRISVGQVEAAYKNETLPENEARSLLGQLRYPDDEVDVLIGAWGKDLSISEQRLQLEQQRFAFQQQRAQQSDALRQQLQARQLDAALQRQQAGFEQAAQRQATAIQAASDRQDKALVAAQQKEAASLAERDKALQQARDLAAQARAATDARQQRSLQASADRQQQVFQQQDKLYQQRVQDRVAAEQRAQQYKLAAEQRSQQYQIAKEQRSNVTRIQTEMRAQSRELQKELRQQGFQAAKEQRQTSQRIATEQRASERAAALATANAQAESALANIRLQQEQTTQKTADQIMADIEAQVQQQIQSLTPGA